MSDEGNDELEFEEDEESVEDSDAADDADDDSGADDSDGDSGLDKRIRDLQSKADAAEARANKAERLLAKSKAQGEGASVDPEVVALRTELREASLDAVMGEFPELRKFGIDRSLIEGSNRAELRDSARSLSALIKKVSTAARNEALAEAGITPAPAGNTRQKPVDYASMPKDEFEKLLNSIV